MFAILKFEHGCVCVCVRVRVWGLGLFAQFYSIDRTQPFRLGSGTQGCPRYSMPGWLSEMILNVLTHDRFSHCLLPNLRLNFDFATMNSFSNSQFLDRLRFMCVRGTLSLSLGVCCLPINLQSVRNFWRAVCNDQENEYRNGGLKKSKRK